jgi:hypothetical protein
MLRAYNDEEAVLQCVLSAERFCVRIQPQIVAALRWPVVFTLPILERDNVRCATLQGLKIIVADCDVHSFVAEIEQPDQLRSARFPPPEGEDLLIGVPGFVLNVHRIVILRGGKSAQRC